MKQKLSRLGRRLNASDPQSVDEAMRRERRVSRIAKSGAGVLAVATAFFSSGCSVGGLEAPSEKNVVSVGQELYLLGSPFPNGTVNVCYDKRDGNNPTLLAEAQIILSDSWSQAAQISFVGWGPCPRTPSKPTVAIHFKAGSNGATNPLGYVSPASGFTSVTLVSDDTVAPQLHFTYEVIHEFGHALGFAHEQERPDNWDAGVAVYCNNVQGTRKAMAGGIYETPYFDTSSIMSYCTGWRNLLSSGDIFGARQVYGRNAAAHGFMILSDTDASLAVNAWDGAQEGTTLRLHNGCTIDNPDCTWSYQNGMIVSDTDPSLAINAWGGAQAGTVLKLTRSCDVSNPDCTWTYNHGQFVSDRNNALAINAVGGAQFGTTLALSDACSASNPDCTWTMPNVMLSFGQEPTAAINAYGGAADGTAIKLHEACTAANSDCTWTFSKGELISDTDSTLALNAYGGASDGGLVLLNQACTSDNPDCTWTWTQGQLVSDNQSAGSFTIWPSAFGTGANIILNGACTPGNSGCLFSGFFARN